MRKLTLILVCLSVFVGCSLHRSHVPGWAEKAASNWAAAMGKTDVPITCTYTQFLIGNGDDFANCSVNMGDRIYKLFCWVEYDISNEQIARTCSQDK